MPLRIPRPNLPRAVYWLSLLAFALRLGARLCSGIAAFWVNGYIFFFQLAQSIAAGKGYAQPDGTLTAFRVPAYPVLLAALTMGHELFWPIAIAQSLIGAGTVLCAALLARQMFPGPAAARAATLAAAITAIYPYYVIHDTAIQETSLFTLLTLVSVILLRRTASEGRVSQGALSGFLLGLDVLTRATIAPFAALAPIWLIWRRRPRAGTACALLTILAVLPWMVRNYEVLVSCPRNSRT